MEEGGVAAHSPGCPSQTRSWLPGKQEAAFGDTGKPCGSVSPGACSVCAWRMWEPDLWAEASRGWQAGTQRGSGAWEWGWGWGMEVVTSPARSPRDFILWACAWGRAHQVSLHTCTTAQPAAGARERRPLSPAVSLLRPLLTTVDIVLA